jgi:hypothetical protein
MQQKRITRTKLAATAIGIALALMPRMSEAQTGAASSPATITMTAGEEKEICSAPNAVHPDAAKNGTWRIKPDDKDKTLVHVLYKANAVTAPATEVVPCGPENKPFTITVVPPATGSNSLSSTGSTDAGTRSATTGFSNDAYGEAFKALFLLFVLATVLESALAILFNWRPFVETFNARAVRPVVSLGFALVLVFTFKLDIVSGLAKIITPATPPLDAAGPILTAMVIAGGSAAVNNLLVTLGFRQLRTPETVTPKPPLNKGWISVSVIRTNAIKGPVDVRIGVPDAAGAVPAVARLAKSTKPGWRYFFHDPGRFPGAGGYAVSSGATVKVVCTAATAADGAVKTEAWGPNVIADGAIIDLTFTM